MRIRFSWMNKYRKKTNSPRFIYTRADHWIFLITKRVVETFNFSCGNYIIIRRWTENVHSRIGKCVLLVLSQCQRIGQQRRNSVRTKSDCFHSPVIKINKLSSWNKFGTRWMWTVFSPCSHHSFENALNSSQMLSHFARNSLISRYKSMLLTHMGIIYWRLIFGHQLDVIFMYLNFRCNSSCHHMYRAMHGTLNAKLKVKRCINRVRS